MATKATATKLPYITWVFGAFWWSFDISAIMDSHQFGAKRQTETIFIFGISKTRKNTQKKKLKEIATMKNKTYSEGWLASATFHYPNIRNTFQIVLL